MLQRPSINNIIDQVPYKWWYSTKVSNLLYPRGIKEIRRIIDSNLNSINMLVQMFKD